ncbi:hypothetical protein B0T14DRAFT_7142 [Immersiella caudata]|uniref:Uncharacterized protein n=1 Tax=Immersiella caudata TaxID=314043 RepID=A0AA39XCZ2_9PEZI|nr:hypothetical protein B0T14DRAFT_7142 [Immersiella caudata]
MSPQHQWHSCPRLVSTQPSLPGTPADREDDQTTDTVLVYLGSAIIIIFQRVARKPKADRHGQTPRWAIRSIRSESPVFRLINQPPQCPENFSWQRPPVCTEIRRPKTDDWHPPPCEGNRPSAIAGLCLLT